MSFPYFIDEFGRNLRRSPLSHLGSLLMSVILFGLFNIVWIGSRVLDDHFLTLYSEAQMEVFFAENISEADFTRRAQEIRDRDGVARVEVFNKEGARRRLADRLGVDHLAGASNNPLPVSILLGFERGYPSLANLSKLESELGSWTEVILVSYDREWLEETESSQQSASAVLRVAQVVTFGGAMLNAALLVGLIVRSKTRSFSQLRLLGAGGFFLGAPHVLEGALLTFVSASLSWGLTVYGQRRFDLSWAELALPSYEEMAILVLLAAVAGAFGAWLAVVVSLRSAR